jgi:hypothetical protein
VGVDYDQVVELAGDDEYFMFGATFATTDVDGDGFDDLFATTGSHENAAGTDVGAVHLFYGPISSDTVSSATAGYWEGADEDIGFGAALTSGGDLDDDGLADLLIGAPLADYEGTSSGRLFLVNGPVSAVEDAADVATVTVDGSTGSDRVGHWGTFATGDFDGDGFSDLAVGAFEGDAGVSDGGEVGIFYGPLSGTMELNDADATIWGEDEDGDLGGSVVSGFDFDSDGVDDLSIGARSNSEGAVGGGAVYVLTDVLGSSGEVGDSATLIIYGEEGQKAGATVAVRTTTMTAAWTSW